MTEKERDRRNAARDAEISSAIDRVIRNSGSLIGTDRSNNRYGSLYADVSRLKCLNALSLENVSAESFSRTLLRYAGRHESFRNWPRPVRLDSDDAFRVMRYKLSAAAWNPIWGDRSPIVASPRICPECHALGHHSWATQCEILERCPIHSTELVQFCPSCRIPTEWSLFSQSIIPNAFQCSSSCGYNILNMAAAGNCARAFDVGLEKHVRWIEAVRKVRFATPFLDGLAASPMLGQGEGRRLQLFRSVLAALKKCGVQLPDFPAYLISPAADWKVLAEPLSDHLQLDNRKNAREVQLLEARKLLSSLWRSDEITRLPILERVPSRNRVAGVSVMRSEVHEHYIPSKYISRWDFEFLASLLALATSKTTLNLMGVLPLSGPLDPAEIDWLNSVQWYSSVLFKARILRILSEATTRAARGQEVDENMPIDLEAIVIVVGQGTYYVRGAHLKS